MPYQTLADTVLLVHFGIVLFVVLGLPVIILGNRLGWPWVNRMSWRLAHLAAIVIVVLQAWLGKLCALTDLESWLREQAGQAGYQGSFIEYWVHRLIYFEAPIEVFAVVYTAFGALVAWSWWKYPPGKTKEGHKPEWN